MRCLDALFRLVTTTNKKDKVLKDALDEEWKVRQRAVRDELDDLAAGVPTDLRAVRDVLIARRQWELLRNELASGSARKARQKLKNYDVGMQTLQTRGPELARLNANVKRAARRTVWHNLPWELRGVRGLAVRASIRVAVWAGFKVVTAPPKESTAAAGRQGAEESPPPD